MTRNKAILKILFLFLLSCFSANTVKGSVVDTSAIHELTVYVIKSSSPLNWESPSSLYRTSLESYTKSLFSKNLYSIGHLFIELSTPLLDSVVLTSIRSTSGAEKRRLVLKEKIGLGMLGAVLHGRMETREELTKKIDHFSKKKNGIRFITYRICEESAKRIVEFLEKFTKKFDAKNKPCDFYGGAFWSRFENEGGGCTSFGMSAMEVAGLFNDYPEWRVSVNIPLYLIGGEYNNGHRVKRSSILRAHTWYEGSGEENVDFVPITVYDPSLIFDWIDGQRRIRRTTAEGDTIKGEISLHEQPAFKPVVKNSIPGLYVDSRNIIPAEEPVFKQRKQPSVFINTFRNKIF
ncbi:MAG: hypothetical protein A2X18_11475 [Bacteroidetes bacterium GWF2_40_14]|nr:MAG: hypothetical protein A2X18_11475 [Bacteroidetes bacterium GWF2_40_14]